MEVIERESAGKTRRRRRRRRVTNDIKGESTKKKIKREKWREKKGPGKKK